MDREVFAEYLADDSRSGPALDRSWVGSAGGAACGDVARISLLIEDGRVRGARFGAEGCGAIRAACAAVTELVDGELFTTAARIGAREVDTALGGLTPGKLHAAQFAADALHRALGAAAASVDHLAEPSPGRVLVAMSGGVDSAVAALLERQRGADVCAVTLKLWADPRTDGTKACCSPEAVTSARALAHSLGLPHITLDMEDEFRARVVGAFVEGYAAGRTPNPCVLCNGDVRIAAMVRLADRLGATHLVTGHYARVTDDGEGPLLAAAADPAKDQGYMLAGLPTEMLDRLRFPLAEMTKSEARAFAEGHGLPVAQKAESQDLCFLAGQGKRAFLREHGQLDDRAGEIVDRSGEVRGTHAGHHHFTVGQRRGLGVSSTEPLFVLGTDASANRVTIGDRGDLFADSVSLRAVTLHRDSGQVTGVRFRYHAPIAGCSVEADLQSGRHASVTLSLTNAVDSVAPGQTAVLLRGEEIIGHGTIVAGMRVTDDFAVAPDSAILIR